LLNVAGQSISAAEFSTSLSSWDDLAQQMIEFHQTYDFYITPTSAFTAPEIGELTHSDDKQREYIERIHASNQEEQQELIYEMFLRGVTYTPYSPLANLTGQPAISLPIRLSDKGLPIGVQVMANKGLENELLKLADKVEQSDLWVGMKGNRYFNS